MSSDDIIKKVKGKKLIHKKGKAYLVDKVLINKVLIDKVLIDKVMIDKVMVDEFTSYM